MSHGVGGTVSPTSDEPANLSGDTLTVTFKNKPQPLLTFTTLSRKYWEIIADNLRKAGWRSGCISSTDHGGRQFWVVAAEREGARHFIVRADEKLTAFLELEVAISPRQRRIQLVTKSV